MHQVFFGAKRVFHGGVRVTRRRLRRVAPGMTAARFDMMYAIGGERRRRSRKFSRGKLEQRALRGRLGVSAPVVSRMLRSLEELGWVRRSRRKPNGLRCRRRVLVDARQVDVELTAAGLLCLRRAFRAVHLPVEHLVYRAICWGKHRDGGARFMNMDTLESYLHGLRRHCRDRARLYFPWGHPDD
jgi:DNA-binding MarR family transcriptional regulator